MPNEDYGIAYEQSQAELAVDHGLKVSLVLLIVFPVLGLVLHGLASTLAWVAFLIVIGSFVGPAVSPQTSIWKGPCKDRRLH